MATRSTTWCATAGGTGHIVPWNDPMQISGRTVRCSAWRSGKTLRAETLGDACLTSRAARSPKISYAMLAGFPAVASDSPGALGEEAARARVSSGRAHLSVHRLRRKSALWCRARLAMVCAFDASTCGKAPHSCSPTPIFDSFLAVVRHAGHPNARPPPPPPRKPAPHPSAHIVGAHRFMAKCRAHVRRALRGPLKFVPCRRDPRRPGPLIPESSESIVCPLHCEASELTTVSTRPIVLERAGG